MTEKKYGEKAIEEAELEAWENPYPDRDYLIEITSFQNSPVYVPVQAIQISQLLKFLIFLINLSWNLDL